MGQNSWKGSLNQSWQSGLMSVILGCCKWVLTGTGTLDNTPYSQEQTQMLRADGHVALLQWLMLSPGFMLLSMSRCWMMSLPAAWVTGRVLSALGLGWCSPSFFSAILLSSQSLNKKGPKEMVLHCFQIPKAISSNKEIHSIAHNI